jgi:hypothetical protein
MPVILARRLSVRVALLVLTSILLFVSSPGAVQSSRTAPETFIANAQAKAGGGVGAAIIEIHIERYTPDADRTSVETALKTGGYPGFVTALRNAPDVGYVEVGGQKFTIRWARERESKKGRTIVVVTDKPVFFVGGGRADAKPRAGYEVAVVQLDMDLAGIGSGIMAAAARVKPGTDGGVQIDDYAEQPIKLISVTRKLS